MKVGYPLSFPKCWGCGDRQAYFLQAAFPDFPALAVSLHSPGAPPPLTPPCSLVLLSHGEATPPCPLGMAAPHTWTVTAVGGVGPRSSGPKIQVTWRPPGKRCLTPETLGSRPIKHTSSGRGVAVKRTWWCSARESGCRRSQPRGLQSRVKAALVTTTLCAHLAVPPRVWQPPTHGH